MGEDLASPPPTPPLPTPSPFQPKLLRAAFLTHADALQSSSRCCGGSQRRADWANGAGHTKKQRTKESASLLTGDPQPLPPLQRAADSGAQPLPDLQGSPPPYGRERLLLSHSGAP